MRLRPKVKELLPKIAEVLISHRNRLPGTTIEIVRRGRPPLSMYLVLESILFVLTRVAAGELSIGHRLAGTLCTSISVAGVSAVR